MNNSGNTPAAREYVDEFDDVEWVEIDSAMHVAIWQDQVSHLLIVALLAGGIRVI